MRVISPKIWPVEAAHDPLGFGDGPFQQYFFVHNHQ
jgi:hypothetical protein